MKNNNAKEITVEHDNTFRKLLKVSIQECGHVTKHYCWIVEFITQTAIRCRSYEDNSEIMITFDTENNGDVVKGIGYGERLVVDFEKNAINIETVWNKKISKQVEPFQQHVNQSSLAPENENAAPEKVPFFPQDNNPKKPRTIKVKVERYRYFKSNNERNERVVYVESYNDDYCDFTYCCKSIHYDQVKNQLALNMCFSIDTKEKHTFIVNINSTDIIEGISPGETISAEGKTEEKEVSLIDAPFDLFEITGIGGMTFYVAATSIELAIAGAKKLFTDRSLNPRLASIKLFAGAPKSQDIGGIIKSFSIYQGGDNE